MNLVLKLLIVFFIISWLIKDKEEFDLPQFTTASFNDLSLRWNKSDKDPLLWGDITPEKACNYYTNSEYDNQNQTSYVGWSRSTTGHDPTKGSIILNAGCEGGHCETQGAWCQFKPARLYGEFKDITQVKKTSSGKCWEITKNGVEYKPCREHPSQFFYYMPNGALKSAFTGECVGVNGYNLTLGNDCSTHAFYIGGNNLNYYSISGNWNACLNDYNGEARIGPYCDWHTLEKIPYYKNEDPEIFREQRRLAGMAQLKLQNDYASGRKELPKTEQERAIGLWWSYYSNPKYSKADRAYAWKELNKYNYWGPNATLPPDLQ